MKKIFTSFIIILATHMLVHAAPAPDKYDLLRRKWKSILIGANGDESKYITAKKKAIIAEGQAQWDNLIKTQECKYLWDDLSNSKASAEVTYAYRRLYSMALAYSTPASSLTGNITLRDDIINALLWMNENRYVKMYGNWWDFQIGAPLELNNCITLMYDDLNVSQRAALNERLSMLTGNPNTDTGANRAWRAFVWALNGILKKDPTKIEISKNALSAIFNYTTKGDGFYTDGSFVQHANHPYNLGYGIDAVAKLSDLMHLLHDSEWAVTDPQSQNLYNWITNSYAPLIYKGIAMDMVRGREISRSFTEDYKAGFSMIGNIAKIAQFAPAPYAESFKSMVKYWVTANTQHLYFENAVKANNITLNTIKQVQGIVENSAVKPWSEVHAYNQFAMMDRVVKHAPDFAFAVSMHSARIANFEGDVNNENLKAWHTADGMTYLYNDDLTQYNGNFWPTVDNHRLPGTTVLASTPIASDKASKENWVGGATLAHIYGVTGMAYQAYGYNLRAKKSWFMFENEIVALGAGISGMDNKEVETIIENRKLSTKGTNKLSINGKAQATKIGWKADDLSGVKHAHLAGSVPGSDIGYYFPGGAKLNALREARTANWNSINMNPSTSDSINHTNNFFTLWFNHGKNPNSAGYSYVMLPGFLKKQVDKYSKNPEIEVLRNDSLVQAVKENKLNITAANFWTDTKQSAGILNCDKKASVIIKESTNVLEVGISDPTQLNAGTITVTINKSAKSLVSKDPRVTVVQLHPTIILNIDANGAFGRSADAIFNLQ